MKQFDYLDWKLRSEAIDNLVILVNKNKNEFNKVEKFIIILEAITKLISDNNIKI